MEENETLIILDVSKLCRICLLEKNLPINLYSDECSVLHMIESSINVKVNLIKIVPL